MGNPSARATFSPRTGDYRDETSIRCGHAGRPLPVIILRFRQPRPGSGGSLSCRPQRDRAPRRAPDAGGSADPVDAGRQPGEMAPRPYHLVLRAIPARRACARATSPSTPTTPFCSIPIMSAPARATPAHQRGHLTRPGAEEVTAYRRHVDAAVVKFFHEAGEDTLRQARAAGRGRPQSRAAASGIDADRHPARVRAKPDSAGLRSGSGAFRPRRRGGDEWVTLNEGIHTIGHADDSFHFDNEKPAHRALVGPVKLARNLVTNAEWLAFMADGGYATRDAVADGRFCRRRQRGLAGARPLARDRRRMAGHDAWPG